MRQQAEEEEGERKKKAKTEEAEAEEEDFLCTQEKRKSLSSQLLPSFVVASEDANKENVDVPRNVSYVKKSENVLKHALEVPLKTRGNDADVVVLDWKKQKTGTDDVEADFIRASLTPPKGGEKKKSGDDKSSGKRCVDVRVGSAALSARDGKKARVVVVGKRTKEKQNLLSSEQILLQRTRALGKQVDALSTRLETMEKFLMDTITARFEETNAFVFEVLTAVASTSRRADEQMKQTEQTEQIEQTKQIEQTEQTEHVAAKQMQKSLQPIKKKMSSKEKASMGLCFREAVTLDDFLDGYNTQVNLSPKRVLALTKAEKSKRSSYINYWKPFARIFRDALSDFETLFGDKAGEYIGEFELAMEEALVVSAGADEQIESRRADEQKRWKSAASTFISASAKTRQTMRTSWNLKGIMNQMHLKTFTLT